MAPITVSAIKHSAKALMVGVMPVRTFEPDIDRKGVGIAAGEQGDVEVLDRLEKAMRAPAAIAG
jgi:hypothetical protein